MTKGKSEDDQGGATSTEGDTPQSLVGSGEKMVKVRANAGSMGLAAGETGTFPDSEELRGNVRSGNFELIKE